MKKDPHLENTIFTGPNAHVFYMILGTILTYTGFLVAGIGLGLFPDTQTIYWYHRVMCLAFAAFPLRYGIPVFMNGLRSAVNKHGPRSGAFYHRFAVYMAGKITWQTILASLPYFLFSLQFYFLWQFGWLLPGTDTNTLRLVLPVEFALLHSTLFMGLFSLFRITDRGRHVKYVIIACFGLFYVALIGGHVPFTGLIFFIVLLVSKYGGYYLRPPDADQKLALFMRWGAQFLTFILTCAMTDNKSLNSFRNIPTSFWYFLFLGAYEFLGIFFVRDSRAIYKKD